MLNLNGKIFNNKLVLTLSTQEINYIENKLSSLNLNNVIGTENGLPNPLNCYWINKQHVLILDNNGNKLLIDGDMVRICILNGDNKITVNLANNNLFNNGQIQIQFDII